MPVTRSLGTDCNSAREGSSWGFDQFAPATDYHT
jgi:hypothetical protein